MHDDHLRGVARGDCQACCASFERRHAFFEDGAGRISDAGVDISEGLQAKQRGGVIDVVKHKRRCLIDRRCPGASGGIGFCARVNCQSFKSWNAFRFCHVPPLKNYRRALSPPWNTAAVSGGGLPGGQGGEKRKGTQPPPPFLVGGAKGPLCPPPPRVFGGFRGRGFWFPP